VATASSPAGWQRPLIVIGSVILAVVVIACLYWAEAVFVPLALATLLTFMLSPLVNRLQRLRLGRIPSVLLVVVAAGVLLGAVGWGVTLQVTALLKDLPKHTGTMQRKLADLRGGGKESIWGNLQTMFEEVTHDVVEKIPPPEGNAGDGPERVVVMQPEESSWLTKLPATLRPLLEPLGGAFLTIILVIFMLIKREDLRNRLISLVGHGRLTHTTKALDDAGQRISRYLVMQFVINACFGLALGVGLWAIGLDYAFLWGFLGGVLRYLPYIGTWLAALPPIVLSLAMFEGWVQPLLVLGLFLALELVTANVLEPLLFGHSTGISAVALLVAAAFWTWLWGPLGLVLSGPLTVCLVVLGKYVPALKFFDVLMGDEPPLGTDVSYYQRLLAMDQDEATEIVAAYVKANSSTRSMTSCWCPP
jgi:predicted PurR-regulated permease PerM